MNEARCIEILVPRSERVNRLVIDYGALPGEMMENAIQSLIKRLGDERMNEVLSCYHEKKLDGVAEKLLEYYDQTYQHSRDKFKRKLTEITLPNGDAAANSEIILKSVTRLF